MDNFAIEGLAGLPQDPRPARGDQSKRVDGPKKRGFDPVSFKGGKYLQAIEKEKQSLLGSPFVREERVDTARRDLDAGNLDRRESLDDAAEKMLGGDETEHFDLGDF